MRLRGRAYEIKTRAQLCIESLKVSQRRLMRPGKAQWCASLLR